MATAQVEIESQIIELSTTAFQAFCNEISETFGVDMKCEQQEVSTDTIANLKKRFKKQVAVNVVDSKGLLNGTFQLIFDQDGLFTLGGIIVNLSEKEILANRKDASAKRAESMVDAVGEAGNLLAASFDNVFREGLDGHDHFSQRLPAFVGKPWGKPEEKIGLAKNDELVFVLYEMTVGSFPAFKCGVVFPKTIFAAPSDSAPEQTPAAEEEAKDKEEQENPETEIVAEEVSDDTSAGEDTEGAAETDNTDPVEQTPSAEDDSVVEDSVAEEKSEAPEKSDEPVLGKISETIQKMARSLADSPGESDRSETEINAALDIISKLSQISAKEIMQNQIVWADSNDSVQKILAKMQQNNVGYVIVGKNGVPEGIVSQSDITGAISPYLRPLFTKWRRPSDDATLQIKIKWIMNKPVRTVGMETSLAAVIENMSRFGVRALPVVDEQGTVQGLITVFDIFRVLLNTGPSISTIENVPQATPSE